MLFQPENEQGVIVAFAMNASKQGWYVISIQTDFPDAVLRYDNLFFTEQWVAEFEYKASNFLTHGHDPRGCELIVCWENDWPDCPLPVLEICHERWAVPGKVDPATVEVAYWKQRALRAERELLKQGRGEVGTDLFPPVGRPKANDHDLIEAAIALVKQGMPIKNLTSNFFRRRLGPIHNGGEQLGKERAARIQRQVFESLGLLDETLDEMAEESQ